MVQSVEPTGLIQLLKHCSRQMQYLVVYVTSKSAPYQSLIFRCIHHITFFVTPSFWLGSIEMSTSLQPLILVSLRRSRIYFCCETIILFLDRATSIPRKHHKDPKSLILNFDERDYFSRFISSKSLLMRIMSFTYIINTTIFPSCECLTNMV